MTRLFSGLAILAGLGFLVLAACADQSADTPATQASTQESNMKTETATFAMGCFWGSEATFKKVPGVVSARVGYAGGRVANPTYEEVCTETTGHAESVEVVFDPSKVTYQQLLNVFFENHDPTTVDQQGPDFGAQYRSVIFYHSPEQKKLAEAEKAKRDASGDYVGPIVTQIVPAGTFYSAEEYHQDYFAKMGVNYTCHLGNGKKATVSR
jgi:peptide-methionine (S)-S-oxide reductase